MGIFAINFMVNSDAMIVKRWDEFYSGIFIHVLMHFYLMCDVYIYIYIYIHVSTILLRAL